MYSFIKNNKSFFYGIFLSLFFQQNKIVLAAEKESFNDIKSSQVNEMRRHDLNYRIEFLNLWEKIKLNPEKLDENIETLTEMLEKFLVAYWSDPENIDNFYVGINYLGNEKDEKDSLMPFIKKFFNHAKPKKNNPHQYEYVSQKQPHIKYYIRIDSKMEIQKKLEEGPMSYANGEIQQHTSNNMGCVMYTKNAFLKEYIKFSKEKFNNQDNKSPVVLDIGAATGVNDYDILISSKKGDVYANDLSKNALLKFRNVLKKDLQERLYLNSQHFPSMLDYSENKFDAILISHVFHYLKPEEIEEGLKKAYTWLKPGGKIFIQALTVYSAPFTCFIPAYVKNKECKLNNLTYFEDWSRAVHENLPLLEKPSAFPDNVHPIKPGNLNAWMLKAGFESDVRYAMFDETKTVNPLNWKQQKAWLDKDEQTESISNRIVIENKQDEKEEQEKEILAKQAEELLKNNQEWLDILTEIKKIYKNRKTNHHSKEIEGLNIISAIGTKPENTRGNK